MGIPKWQEPLAARVAGADQTIRQTLVASCAGAGAGAVAAAALADRELAALSEEFAGRSPSPLLQVLLRHGARALLAQADALQAAVVDDLVDGPVWAELEYDDEGQDDEPVGQALVDPAPEPVATSDDAAANESSTTSQASLVDRAAVAQTLADVGATVVHRGEAYEPASGEAAANEPADVRVDATLNTVADLVEQVRADAVGWLLRDDSNVPYARQAALDGVAGIDRCVALLQRLRFELAAGVVRADAAAVQRAESAVDRREAP